MTISDRAMAILQAHREGRVKLSRRAGNFMGECCVDPQPLSEKQHRWFGKLNDAASLPPLGEWEPHDG